MRLSACLAVVILAGVLGYYFADAGVVVEESPSPAASKLPDLGQNASLNGRKLFPDDNEWNRDVSGLAVDPNSSTIIGYVKTDASGNPVGATTTLHPDWDTTLAGGIPYYVVSGTQRKVPLTISYTDESEPGPFPIPPTANIEGGGTGGNGDSHCLVLDRDNWKLYETYLTRRQDSGRNYLVDGAAIYNLYTNALRPKGWTSPDAAGLPIMAGLARYDEVADGLAGGAGITHALRLTVPNTRHAFIPPATHYASSKTGTQYAPMGARFRLRATYNINQTWSSPQTPVILTALKKYGLILADNGSAWFITGAGDPRWDMGTRNIVDDLRKVLGSDLELVLMNAPMITN